MLGEGGQRCKELSRVVYRCPWDTDVLRSREHGGKEHLGGASGLGGVASLASVLAGFQRLLIFLLLRACVKAHIVNQPQHAPHWTCKHSRVLPSSHCYYHLCPNSKGTCKERGRPQDSHAVCSPLVLKHENHSFILENGPVFTTPIEAQFSIKMDTVFLL